MHPSWVVSVPSAASISAPAEGQIAVAGPAGRLLLRRLSPALGDALARLAYPGERLADLLAAVEGDREPGATARLLYFLRLLADRGLLWMTAVADGAMLATLAPAGRGPALTHERIASGPGVLSRFAYLRRAGSETLLESPLSSAKVFLHDWRAAAMLHALSAAPGLAGSAGTIPGLSPDAVEAFVTLLGSAGMLTPVNPAGACAEDEHASLMAWEFHDLAFHARSREGRHDAPVGNTYRLAGRLAQPPVVKPPVSSQVMDLVRPNLEALARHDPPLVRVMEQRRSLREYGAEPITADQLGEFLWRTARIQEAYEFDVLTPLGTMRLGLTSRPYPTGGALGALEVYPVVRACGNLERGLYHYDPLGHRLERLADWTPEVQHLSDHAGVAMGQAPDRVQVLLVLAARFQRVSWKYSTLAYSLILKDVGGLMQTMYLAATAMNLAPCAIGVGDSDRFAKAIGSDYYAETSVGEFALGSRK